MAVSFSTGLVNKILGATGSGGAPFCTVMANGVIDVYSGVKPVNADAPVGSAVLLGTVTQGGLPFVAGTATNGINLVLAVDRGLNKSTSENWQFTAIASGQATWFRHRGNAADNGSASTILPRIDGTIGQFGADAQMDNTNIVAGEYHSFNKAEITMALV